MAPKPIFGIVAFTIIFSLLFVAIPAPTVKAFSGNNNSVSNTTLYAGSDAPVQGQSKIKDHSFKFYLDPTLAPSADFAKSVLPKYVEDMNTILAKNTNRRLVFNPETDIILTSVQPHSDQANLPLPVEDFELWAYAVKTSAANSYGGYAGVDGSGAGVLAGLKWTRIYDPENVTSGELADYWTQINNMLHEIAHVFGAGIGEYYKLSTIQDTTGTEPVSNINVFDPKDAYWSDKQDFMSDPLLRNVVQTADFAALSSREALLGYVTFSGLTAEVLSGNFRNSTPTVDLNHVAVSVVSNLGEPIEAANVKIWSVIGNAPYQAKLMVDANTDAQGQVLFSWGGSSNPHNNYDFLRLIKVYKDGYLVSARYVSIFDLDITRIVENADTFNSVFTLLSEDTLPKLISVTRASTNPAKAKSVNFTVTFSEPVVGVDPSDFILGANGMEGAEISKISGSGSIYTVSVKFNKGSGSIGLELSSSATIKDLDGNSLNASADDSNSETFTIQTTLPYENLVFLPAINNK